MQYTTNNHIDGRCHMSDKPKEYAPSAFPTHTCPKIDGLLRELREAQEAAKEGNAERITYLLSDWDGRLEELRTANQQLRDAAGGYKDNRDEWMTFASTTEDELATVQDQLEDCKRELDDAQRLVRATPEPQGAGR